MTTAVESSVPMRALVAGARRKESALLNLIQELVRAESPSDDKAAVDGCVALTAAHAKALGGRVKIHRQKGFGNLLEARFGAKSKTGAARRTLLLGHLDTVWPLGTLKTMPCKLSEGRLWGPGTLDMKSGVAPHAKVQATFALR
jgi:glutamate carboxypeptidase